MLCVLCIFSKYKVQLFFIIKFVSSFCYTRIKRESILQALVATMQIVVRRKSVDLRIVRVQPPLPPYIHYAKCFLICVYFNEWKIIEIKFWFLLWKTSFSIYMKNYHAWAKHITQLLHWVDNYSVGIVYSSQHITNVYPLVMSIHCAY